MIEVNAVRFHETGGVDVLRYETVAIDDPGPGEVLVRHTAIGVNYIDTYFRSGLYPVEGLPSGLGQEAVGTVEQIGEAVQGFKVGDRVAYVAQNPGCYADKRVIAADLLVRVPDDLDDAAVAASLLKGMTVEYLIRRTFPVKPGQTVLWHAAAGGVGLIACQWLNSLGVTVIGTVGSEEKAALAREHGCAHAIIYTRENFRDRVMEITEGRGVPVVFDSVGKDTFEGSLDCLQPRGMMVSLGNASGAVPPFAPGMLAQKGSLFLTRPTLYDYIASRTELDESARVLFEVIQNSAIKIHIDRRVPLQNAKQVHVALESRRTRGSLVLVP